MSAEPFYHHPLVGRMVSGPTCPRKRVERGVMESPVAAENRNHDRTETSGDTVMSNGHAPGRVMADLGGVGVLDGVAAFCGWSAWAEGLYPVPAGVVWMLCLVVGSYTPSYAGVVPATQVSAPR